MASPTFDALKGLEELIVLQVRGIEAADRRDGSVAREEQRGRRELLRYSLRHYMKLCKKIGRAPNIPDYSHILERSE